jgi:hypothetical protein
VSSPALLLATLWPASSPASSFTAAALVQLAPAACSHLKRHCHLAPHMGAPYALILQVTSVAKPRPHAHDCYSRHDPIIHMHAIRMTPLQSSAASADEPSSRQPQHRACCTQRVSCVIRSSSWQAATRVTWCRMPHFVLCFEISSSLHLSHSCLGRRFSAGGTDGVGRAFGRQGLGSQQPSLRCADSMQPLAHGRLAISCARVSRLCTFHQNTLCRQRPCMGRPRVAAQQQAVVCGQMLRGVAPPSWLAFYLVSAISLVHPRVGGVAGVSVPPPTAAALVSCLHVL